MDMDTCPYLVGDECEVKIGSTWHQATVLSSSTLGNNPGSQHFNLTVQTHEGQTTTVSVFFNGVSPWVQPSMLVAA